MLPESENRNQHVKLIAEKTSLFSLDVLGMVVALSRWCKAFLGNKGIRIPRSDLGLEKQSVGKTFTESQHFYS